MKALGYSHLSHFSDFAVANSIWAPRLSLISISSSSRPPTSGPLENRTFSAAIPIPPSPRGRIEAVPERGKSFPDNKRPRHASIPPSGGITIARVSHVNEWLTARLISFIFRSFSRGPRGRSFGREPSRNKAACKCNRPAEQSDFPRRTTFLSASILSHLK